MNNVIGNMVKDGIFMDHVESPNLEFGQHWGKE